MKLNDDQLELVRMAIITKVEHWDALHELEAATGTDGEWTDAQEARMIEQIDNLAAGSSSTAMGISDDDIQLAMKDVL